MTTEAEVKAAEAAVLATPIDPVFQREWAKASIEEFRKAEQRVMAQWRMWKFLRDDARMQADQKELERLRACLKYLESILAE